MKPALRRVWQWIPAGSALVFLVFCAIRASHLHPVTASYPRIIATNQLRQTPEPKVQTLLNFNILTGFETGATNKPELPADMPQPDSRVVALARDLWGNIWVGTEGDGVFRYDPDAEPESQWSQFTTNNGLGDNNAYSIICDKQGRIWVGELNHGVAVFDGESWKNYDIMDGPIGERIFRIAICPTDGDVWMATSAGLTRYSVNSNTWRYYTRADGLPSDQASSLAFDAGGNLYVGTQCDGIAIGSAAGDYKQWQLISGPDQLPNTPHGSGLPSGLINDLLVTRDQKIYAATTAGLAFSTNNGKAWQYIRGADYTAKIRGLAGDAPPDDWQPVSQKNVKDLLLPEDYITCLAEDKDTNIWLGFRTQGYAVLNLEAGRILAHDTRRDGWLNDNYVAAMLPGEDFRGYVGSYGGGLMMPEAGTNSEVVQDNVQTNNATTLLQFPSPAKPPTLAEFNALLKEISLAPAGQETNTPTVISLEDDWRTEGAWTGRYGRFWIVLCANWAPKNDVWGAGWDVAYDARIGLSHAPGDSLRYWVQWLATTDNRSLEMSPTYLHSRVLKNLTTWDVDRRESEWDDHGEDYPMSKDGPHIYCSLNIPKGLFYLSLYEINPNGNFKANRFRDYEISIRPHPGRASLDQRIGNTTVMRSFYDIAEFGSKPELARARAADFYGGVYKRFLVRGPAKLTLQVNRNYSFNTILAGAMLDLVDELPPPYYCTRQEWEAKQEQEDARQQSPSFFIPAGNVEEAARRLTVDLDEMPFKNETWWAENKRRIYLQLLRWQLAETNRNDSMALATSYYQLNLFSNWEKQLQKQGVITTREIEKAIRWDGLTYSCAGMGNKLISEYVQAHPEIKKQSVGHPPSRETAGLSIPLSKTTP
jgi:sugar lactone lactonase YvrE